MQRASAFLRVRSSRSPTTRADAGSLKRAFSMQARAVCAINSVFGIRITALGVSARPFFGNQRRLAKESPE